MTKRIGYFDIAKGIGIICVILGHFIPEKYLIRKIISTFHMPLFFLISGYFYKEAENKVFIKKKAKQLLIPYFFTAVVLKILTILKNFVKNGFKLDIVNMISNVLSIFYASGLKTVTFNNIEITYVGAIWFLVALFEALMFVNLTRKTKFQPVIVVILFTIGYYSSKVIWLPFSVQAGMCATLFVYIGHIAKKYEIYNKLVGMKEIVFSIIMFIVWIIGIWFNVNVSMVQNKYNYGIISIVVAISATYCIIQISKLIEKLDKKEMFSKILKLAGKNTLIILCFHLIELDIFPYSIIYKIIPIRLISNILILTIKFAWVSFGVIIVHKLPLLSKIFNINNDKSFIEGKMENA